MSEPQAPENQPRRKILPVLILLIVLANAVFSTLGDGAATRAGTVAWFLWVAYVGVLLIQAAERSRVRTAV